MSFIGIDLGTTGSKVVAFNRGGEILVHAYREYPLIASYPGQAELDAKAVWLSLRDSIREVATQLEGYDPPQCIAVSTLGEAVVPLAVDGAELANAIVSFDNRSLSQFRWFSERVEPETVYDITGLHPLPHYTIFKLMWWREQQPDLYKNAWKFLCFGDYIGVKLGLKPIIDHSMATRTMAFDVHEQQWSQKLLNAARVDREKLPDTAESGTVVGEISHDIASDLNLPPGTLLVLGGLDQACAALGAGVVNADRTLLSLGTAAVIGPGLSNPTVKMREKGILSMPHVVRGLLITFGGTTGGGSLLRWYRDQLGYEEREAAMRTGQDVFDLIVEQIEDKPTDLLMLPHLTGSRFAFEDLSATGVILGLTLSTKKADLIRALLEGVAYELCLIRERFENVDLSISTLRAVGGGSRSAIWMQIIADSMRVPIHAMRVSDAGSLGAALLCMSAIDASRPLEEIVDRYVQVRETYNPRPEWFPYHSKRIETYRAVYRRLKDLYPQLRPDYVR